ncbi:MAG: MotA/TolQ/ExbB proton channel family protein [Pirellulales bacterium]
MHWPVVWGALLTLGFYVMIQKSVIDNPWITRYFASHPVEYITTTMFFVGLAALWLKGRQLKHEPDEPETLIDAVVGDSEPEGAPVSEAAAMLERLLDKGADHRKSFLVRRLHESLGFLDRTRSVDGLDDQLRNLTDTDEVRSHESYSLIRVIISTIPILGFLGTVVGITKAVAQLAQIVGELSFEEAINSVVSGLSVAFDTTALALGLSIVLIFSMFFTSRREMGILSRVERLVSDALVGRFRAADAETDPAVDAVQKMSSELVRKTDKLVQRQAEIWQESLDQSHERWTTMAVTSERQLETALTRALQNSLQAHAAKLEESEAKAEQRVGRYWQEMLTMMENSTQTLDAQYDELRRQGSVMQQAVDATARVIQLEDALNHNLSALRESNHFDETVNSLAAAINLLNAKLGDTNPPEVKLRSESTGRAA